MKLVKSSLLTVILLLAATPSALAGGETGTHGGDVASCKPSSANSFVGQYALDYLLTFQASNHNGDVVDAPTWEILRDRILNNLEQKAPKIARSFRRFVDLMENHGDFTQSKIWQESPFGLVPLDDQKIVGKLPANCFSKANASGTPQTIQAIVRSKASSGMVMYQYDPGIYSQLKTQAPLQFSLLMVHEWLWDLSSDVANNRNINRILHSIQLDSMSSDQLAATFQNLGVDPARPDPDLVTLLEALPLNKTYWSSNGNPRAWVIESINEEQHIAQGHWIDRDSGQKQNVMHLLCDQNDENCRMQIMLDDGSWKGDLPIYLDRTDPRHMSAAALPNYWIDLYTNDDQKNRF